jgi:hypothetical protein
VLVAVGASEGAVFGGAQWIVLRGHVAREGRWAGADVLAWCLGLVVSVSFMSILLMQDTSLRAGIVVGAAAGPQGPDGRGGDRLVPRPHPGVAMRLRQLGNPFVRAILRSPLHGLLRGALLLVTYTGRSSRRTLTIPVMYVEDADGILVYVGQSTANGSYGVGGTSAGEGRFTRP